MNRYVLSTIILLLIASGFYIYTLSTYTYITAKFKELRPFNEHLPVYYKGIVIGNALEKKHSDDFNHTLMRIVIKKKNILLPENTTILLKKEKRNDKERDFLELIYPKEPSNIMLSNGSTIEGIATVDIDTFMSNQHPDDLETIKHNLIQSTENLEIALSNLSDLFVLLQDVVKDNEQSLKSASSNISNTTKHLEQITSKFDNAIKQESLEETMQNINSSINNIYDVTQDLNTTTDSINIAMPRVDATLYETHGLISNANAISCGIRKTLAKRFGGIRLLFGRTINE